MMYYMGFTFVECYNIPIWQRRWFITRLNEEIRRSRDGGGDGATRAAHHNDAGAREMMARQRSQVPAKLRRFT